MCVERIVKNFRTLLATGLVLGAFTASAAAQDLGYGNGNYNVTNFSGFYAGGFVGAAITDEEFSGNWNASASTDSYGLGLMGGGNAQSGNMIFGFEAEVSTTIGEIDINGTTTNQESTIAGRVRAGLAANDRVMLYFTTGLANTSVELSNSTATQDVDLVGWQAGVGAEAMVSSNIFVRGEYLYSNYFDEMIPSTFAANTEYDLETNQVRIGLGYRF